MAIGLKIFKEGSLEYYAALDIMSACKKPASDTDNPNGGMFDAVICLMLANHESGFQLLAGGANSSNRYYYQQDKYWLGGWQQTIDNRLEIINNANSTDSDKANAKADIAVITTKRFLYGNKPYGKKGFLFYLNDVKFTPEFQKLVLESYNKIKDVNLFKARMDEYILGVITSNYIYKKEIANDKNLDVADVTKYYESNEKWQTGAICKLVSLTQGWSNYKPAPPLELPVSISNFVARDFNIHNKNHTKQEVKWREKFELALNIVFNYWDRVVSRSEKKDIEQSTVKEVKVSQVDRQPQGIWKLFNLDYVNRNYGAGNEATGDTLGFGSIDLLRINDISYASSIGSFMNLFNKVNQEPFVQNFGNSYGKRYDRTIRLSPFVESLWKQLGYYTVDKTNVYSDNLFWETDNIYSWYRLIPSGNFWGDTSNVLEYLPAVFFPEYAEVYGSKPLDVTCNYVNYTEQGRNTIESSLKLLRFMVECHAYMPFTRRGEIKITYSPKIKIGQRLKYLPTGEMFYIDSVKHFANCGNMPNAYSIVKVSRGMLDGVDDYFKIIKFEEEEVKNEYKTLPPSGGYFDVKKIKYKSFYFNDNVSKFDINLTKSVEANGDAVDYRNYVDYYLNTIAQSFLNLLNDKKINKKLMTSLKIDRMVVAGDKNDPYFRYMRFVKPENDKVGDGWDNVKDIDKMKSVENDAKYYISSHFYKKLMDIFGDFKGNTSNIELSSGIATTASSGNLPYYVVIKNATQKELSEIKAKISKLSSECVSVVDNKYVFDSNKFESGFKADVSNVNYVKLIDFNSTEILNKAIGDFYESANNPGDKPEDNIVGRINYKTLTSIPKIDKVKDNKKNIDASTYSKSYSDYAINLKSIKDTGNFLISLIDKFYGVEKESARLDKPITLYASSSSEGIVKANNVIDTNANTNLAINRRDFVLESIRLFCLDVIGDSTEEKYKSIRDASLFSSYFDMPNTAIGRYVNREGQESKPFAGLIKSAYATTTDDQNYSSYATQFDVKTESGKNNEVNITKVNKAIARFHHEFRGARIHYNESRLDDSVAEVDSYETKKVEEIEKRLKWYVDQKIFKKLLAKRHYGLRQRFNNTNGRD